jgi:hypothetical protein
MEYIINGVQIAPGAMVKYFHENGEEYAARVRDLQPDGTANLTIHVDGVPTDINSVPCCDTGDTNTWSTKEDTHSSVRTLFSDPVPPVPPTPESSI